MKQTLTRSLKAVKQAVKQTGRRLVQLTGIRLLNRTETQVFLDKFRVGYRAENRLLLPTVSNQTNRSQRIFGPTVAVTHPAYVWRYERGISRAWQLPYGTIRIDNALLCVNFDQYNLRLNVWHRSGRVPMTANTLIAPWSHYVDGVAFGGYYDYCVLVVALLCRIKAAVSSEEFNRAVVAYPLFETAYEREYLSLLGFTPDRIVDSRTTAVQFDYCLLANVGHWIYPNVADIQLLRETIGAAVVLPVVPTRRRIYISRSGRRRVSNEAELIELLRTYDFAIIDDIPRNVAEQVALYKQASVIIGPHGASFTNIVWCEPGTHLIELFSAVYAPDHFRYLARVMQMQYSACQFPVAVGSNPFPLLSDMHVSIPALSAFLDKLLNTNQLVPD